MSIFVKITGSFKFTFSCQNQSYPLKLDFPSKLHSFVEVP